MLRISNITVVNFLHRIKIVDFLPRQITSKILIQSSILSGLTVKSISFNLIANAPTARIPPLSKTKGMFSIVYYYMIAKSS
jgi:hypothetical protein